MSLEDNEALKQAQEFHPEPLGCTNYFGKTESDRNYPRQLNTLILLVLDLHKKVDHLTNLFQTQKSPQQLNNKAEILASEIEALTLQLKNLPVETKKPSLKTARNIFGIK